MKIPSDYVLGADQLEQPVIWQAVSHAVMPGSDTLDLLLRQRFGPGRARRLSTWGRDSVNPDGPHWIGVRSGTTLHTDPRYPRFTHQLIVHNNGWSVAGLTLTVVGEPFAPGTLFCLDTHSPHALIRDIRLGSGLYYLAVSLDAAQPQSRADVLPPLVAFLEGWLW